MNKESSSAAPHRRGPGLRIADWIDSRTGALGLVKKTLEEPIPGGARWAYVFGSGLLFIFLLQVVTGVSLALYYTPTAETAHTSVAYITKQVEGGAFLRSLHSYGSSAMIIVLGLHFLQTFFYGSFKGRRELLWISGALLSFLVLGMGFTGYLLPWDQKAYFATAVGTNVAGQVPLIGTLLTRLLRGGDTIGTLTISRFYLAHVLLIPGSIFLFVGAHILMFRKAGPAGPASEDSLEPKLKPEPFYPRQVLFDMGFALLIMAVLSGLSYLRPVMLGPIANPSDSHFLPRPEWYYLPMFEWLKFWEGPSVVIGVVVIPGLVACVFFLMPFLDRRLERQPWRRPIPVLGVAIVVLAMVGLGVKSQLDDREGPIAAQLAAQHQLEKAYTSAPFEPYVESPDGMNGSAAAGPVDQQVAAGKGVFMQRGCMGCHGATGTGTSMAPSLVGVTKKYPREQLEGLLRNPNPRMRAGNMPAVDVSQDEMNTLVAYLGALGTRGATVPAIYQPRQPIGPAPEGRRLFRTQGCIRCHGPGARGTQRAPSLIEIADRFPGDKLIELLRHPTSEMQAAGMPTIHLNDEQLHQLVNYLDSLKPDVAGGAAKE